MGYRCRWVCKCYHGLLGKFLFSQEIGSKAPVKSNNEDGDFVGLKRGERMIALFKREVMVENKTNGIIRKH
jgi:hypothetical protein